jgi:hypothetical protein
MIQQNHTAIMKQMTALISQKEGHKYSHLFSFIFINPELNYFVFKYKSNGRKKGVTFTK